MKELSIEEKAKAYDEAIERAKKLQHDNAWVTSIFPELKESEDERIWTINYLNNRKLNSSIIEEKESLKRAIAWLERQGEQNPANKVEPKFKVGDWVVYNRNDSSREIIQVYDIRDGRYYFTDNVHFSWSIKECDEKAHLWTIQDAKDGDVLTWDDSKCIALFKEIYNKHSFKSHGCIGACTAVFENWGFHYIENAHPSTKEQRDLLFQKMKEAGYEWSDKDRKLIKMK